MLENEVMQSLIFYGFAGVILAFAFLTIFANKIMYALISAVVVFFAVAGIFFLLGAQYNGVIQVAIYGIAIPILFVFAIMFTADYIDKQTYLAVSPRSFIAFISVGLLFLSFVYLAATSIILTTASKWVLTKELININQHQMFSALANGIFIDYVLAFEFLSILLLIVVVGLSTLNITKGRKND